MKKFLVVLCMLIVGAYASCALLFPVYHIRYRLTVVIKSDGLDYTGSGVIDVSYRILPDSFDSVETAFGGVVEGYAITIDLRARGLVFIMDDRAQLVDPTGTALYPESATLSSLPFVAFGYQEGGTYSVMQKVLEKFQGMRGSVDVPNGKLPMMVRFPDPGVTNRLEELDPNKLDASLGEAKIVKTTLELTDDPVTPIPAAWPEWLRVAKFKHVDILGTSLALSGNILGGN